MPELDADDRAFLDAPGASPPSRPSTPTGRRSRRSSGTACEARRLDPHQLARRAGAGPTTCCATHAMSLTVEDGYDYVVDARRGRVPPRGQPRPWTTSWRSPRGTRRVRSYERRAPRLPASRRASRSCSGRASVLVHH